MRRTISPLIRPLFQFGLLACLFWLVCLVLSLPLHIDWLNALYWTVLAPWIACVALLIFSRNERSGYAPIHQRSVLRQPNRMLTRRNTNSRRRGDKQRYA